MRQQTSSGRRIIIKPRRSSSTRVGACRPPTVGTGSDANAAGVDGNPHARSRRSRFACRARLPVPAAGAQVVGQLSDRLAMVFDMKLSTRSVAAPVIRLRPG